MTYLPLSQQVEQVNKYLEEVRQSLDMQMLRANQQQQIIDQYRAAIYNLELRSNLLIKMLEEKGIMAKEEYTKRWPLYLKSDVGTIGPEGKMDGNLKITFYESK